MTSGMPLWLFLILQINPQLDFTIKEIFLQSTVKKGSTISNVLVYLNFQKLHLDTSYCYARYAAYADIARIILLCIVGSILKREVNLKLLNLRKFMFISIIYIASYNV